MLSDQPSSSSHAWWRQVLFFGLIAIPGMVLITFSLVGDAVSRATLAAILCACVAGGVSAGIVFKRYTLGKPRSRVGKGAAASATGCALILVGAFDGPIFGLVLGAAGVALGSYIVTDGLFELHHRNWAGDEVAG
jgi:hypothetical protein